MVANPTEVDSSPLPSSKRSAPQSQPRRKRTWFGVLQDLYFYFLAYIFFAWLTIGPFFWTWHAAVYADGPKWVAQFYQPLAYLCELCPPLSWLVNEWVNYWIL
ncbi:hypothetical protein [Schlesneria sp. T3-172]|uniref:hypothetical protein n=1 Tax=Schlesneria sphaerica TaxID=3373610 RepID=UPI0037C96DA3